MQYRQVCSSNLFERVAFRLAIEVALIEKRLLIDMGQHSWP
jgi:hypothetical protein